MDYIELNHLYKVYDQKVLAIDDFSIHVEENEFVALIGPSGCGKSTVLRMIAGLEDITAGDLYIDGKRMNDVHAKDRDTSMVFQNYALYPHLDTFDNIAFGLKLRKFEKDEIKKRVEDVSKLLNLHDYLDRKPSQLSGGQRQRVALGRAMVQESPIFLMDEPLSNLDAKLRSKMRVEILELHRELGITTIYVTHDQIEAMSMADKIVVMDHGTIRQIGTPRELYYNPQNLFVAQFIGDPEINILEGVVDGEDIVVGSKRIPVSENMIDKIKKYQGQEINLGIRSENFKAEAHEDNSRTMYKGLIRLIEMRGDSEIIFTEFEGTNIVIKNYLDEFYKVGAEIIFSIEHDKIFLFDKETEDRIEYTAGV